MKLLRRRTATVATPLSVQTPVLFLPCTSTAKAATFAGLPRELTPRLAHAQARYARLPWFSFQGCFERGTSATIQLMLDAGCNSLSEHAQVHQVGRDTLWSLHVVVRARHRIVDFVVDRSKRRS